MPNSTSDIDGLFELTLIGEYGEDAPWSAITKLQGIGTKHFFDKAVSFCHSDVSLRRCRGLDILAQFGVTGEKRRSFSEETLVIVRSVLDQESGPAVIASALHALGHIGQASEIILIKKYVTHADSDVRFAVASALGSFANDEQAIDALLLLMVDGNTEIRDWATFGLGNLGDVDTAEIRQALVERLSDTHLETRTEAMEALAKRRDARVIPALIAYFEDGWTSIPANDALAMVLKRDKIPEHWTSLDCVKALKNHIS